MVETKDSNSSSLSISDWKEVEPKKKPTPQQSYNKKKNVSTRKYRTGKKPKYTSKGHNKERQSHVLHLQSVERKVENQLMSKRGAKSIIK